MNNKLLVISHRGRGNHEFPENTIEACEMVLKEGADALEVDVRFCASGELVVFHDLFLRRMLNRKGMLFSTTLKDLQNLPLPGSSSGKKIFVPTLKEFINHFKGTVPINLDAKVFTPIAGQFAKYIVREIKASDHRSQFWVSSFNPIFLRTVKYCSWDIKTGYLFQGFNLIRRLTEPLWFADYWHPEITLINDKFMKFAREKNKPIFTWNVDDPEDMKRISQYDQIKGAITDDSALFKQIIIP